METFLFLGSLGSSISCLSADVFSADQKKQLFEGWSWFKLNILGLALGTNLKFHTSMTKGWELKVKKFWGLTRTFVAVTGKKLVGETFWLLSWSGLIFYPTQLFITNLSDYKSLEADSYYKSAWLQSLYFHKLSES